MMDKKNQLTPKDLILFEPQTLVQASSKLREFIRFIKFISPGKQLEFSFLEKKPTLIQRIPVAENIILNAKTKSAQRHSNNSLDYLIESLENPFLQYLYRELPPLNRTFDEYSFEHQKIIGLIQSLLKDAPLILLEHPEFGLQEDTINDVICTIDYERKNKSKIILLESESPHLWVKQISKVVSRSKDLRFLLRNANDSEYYRDLKALTSPCLKFHNVQSL